MSTKLFSIPVVRSLLRPRPTGEFARVFTLPNPLSFDFLIALFSNQSYVHVRFVIGWLMGERQHCNNDSLSKLSNVFHSPQTPWFIQYIVGSSIFSFHNLLQTWVIPEAHEPNWISAKSLKQKQYPSEEFNANFSCSVKLNKSVLYLLRNQSKIRPGRSSVSFQKHQHCFEDFPVWYEISNYHPTTK